MKATPPIYRLPNELLERILKHNLPDWGRTVPIDDRRFLSVESFDEPPPLNAEREIRRFRSICRRFAEVGEPVLFTSVAIRFSKHGLKQLEQLAAWPNITRHVKKFTYMVPYYYPAAENLLSSPLVNGSTDRDLDDLRQKANEQKELFESEEDIRVLKKAIGKFTKLNFVKVLRVVDPTDHTFKEYVQAHEGFEGFVDRYWTPACSRGSSALGMALMSTEIPCGWFYSPVLSIKSAENLALYKSQSVFALAAPLSSLTIAFEDGNDLDARISELSNMFETVFNAAENLETIHVGFPRNHPVNLPLEDVFHHATWRKLRTFGVAGWCLNADEIINLAHRHRHTLKGLRLRDVQLKEGSMWKDVLGTLRSEMHRIMWVSLRRIGYVHHFEEINGGGAEVPDDSMLGISTSESDEGGDVGDDESDDEANDRHMEEPVAGPSNYNHHVNGNVATDEDFDRDTNSDDDEHGPEAHENDFPDLHSPESPTRAPWSNNHERSFPDSAEDLGDDGYSVSYLQRKTWEKWVIGCYPEYLER